MARSRTTSRATATALLAGALVLGACDDSRRAISRDDLPDVPTESDVTVRLDDDGFDPAAIDVSTDTLVEFVIADDDHGVKARLADSDERDRYRIDTGRLLADESTFVIFDEAGVYDVVDTEDEDLRMTVTVAAASGDRDGN